MDGAIVGKGGNPSTGSGIFDPNSHMTYGQFFTMLVNAFYPEELGRVSKDGPWHAPAFRVSVNRQLNFNTLDQLMAMASAPINRYNAALVLVRILDDKRTVLPTDGERETVVAKISDWDTMLQDDCWKYYVTSIYAMGIIIGVDDKYPTTAEQYGLTDSILLVMQSGLVTSDGGADQSDAALNALIEGLTGYHDIEAIRQQYVKDLDTGEWVFDGFVGYADNWITEGLPGVPPPTYPKPTETNLCLEAGTYGGSGEASAPLSPNNLVDGNLSTRWEASRKDVAEPDKLNQGVKHGIVISLCKPMTFDTYTLYHKGSQRNSRKNIKSWRINYYNAQAENWELLDQVQGNTEDVTTRTFDPVTTRFLWLEVLNPSGTGDGTVRLYELEVYNRR